MTKRTEIVRFYENPILISLFMGLEIYPQFRSLFHQFQVLNTLYLP